MRSSRSEVRLKFLDRLGVKLPLGKYPNILYHLGHYGVRQSYHLAVYTKSVDVVFLDITRGSSYIHRTLNLVS